jgi:hypothetical protein
LDGFLKLNERNILEHAGKISHEMAMNAAEKEYEKYYEIQKKEFDQLESDFEKVVMQLMGKKAAQNTESSESDDISKPPLTEEGEPTIP